MLTIHQLSPSLTNLFDGNLTGFKVNQAHTDFVSSSILNTNSLSSDHVVVNDQSQFIKSILWIDDKATLDIVGQVVVHKQIIADQLHTQCTRAKKMNVHDMVHVNGDLITMHTSAIPTDVENIQVRKDMIVNKNIVSKNELNIESLLVLKNALFDGNIWVDQRVITKAFMASGPALFEQSIDILGTLFANKMLVQIGSQFNSNVNINASLDTKELIVLSDMQINVDELNIDQGWQCQKAHVVFASLDNNVSKNLLSDVLHISGPLITKDVQIMDAHELFCEQGMHVNGTFIQDTSAVFVNQGCLHIKQYEMRDHDIIAFDSSVENNMLHLKTLDEHGAHAMFLTHTLPENNAFHLTWQMNQPSDLSLSTIKKMNNDVDFNFENQFSMGLGTQVNPGKQVFAFEDKRRQSLPINQKLVESTILDDDPVLYYDIKTSNIILSAGGEDATQKGEIHVLTNNMDDTIHSSAINVRKPVGIHVPRLDLIPTKDTISSQSTLFYNANDGNLNVGSNQSLVTIDPINLFPSQSYRISLTNRRMVRLDDNFRRTSQAIFEFRGNSFADVIFNGKELMLQISQFSTIRVLNPSILRLLTGEMTITLPENFIITYLFTGHISNSPCVVLNVQNQNDIDANMSIGSVSDTDAVQTRNIALRFALARQGSSGFGNQTEFTIFSAQSTTFALKA